MPRLYVHRPLAERFHENCLPEPNSGCWLWDGAIDPWGYGLIGLTPRWERKTRAHRVSYELHCGPIPDGHNVLHRCDNPPCVNPDHLFAGTQAENMRDMDRKGRRRTVAPRGTDQHFAKLTDVAVAVIRHSDIPSAVLAERFGVSRVSINYVRARKTWKHLP